MRFEDASTQYVIKNGEKLDLSARDGGDKSLWKDGKKKKSYKVMEEMTARLAELQKVLYAENKHKVLVVVQAMDAGGKDGCVRNVFMGLDPLGVDVTAFKKPSEEELAHDFLWRVHAKAPRNGMIGVFNRSHYEDVIAVRVKKIFGEKVWKRRYKHIVDFEQMLADEGTKIVKIFLNIDKEEQRERFQSRLDTPAKHWKFLPDDLEDRARWDDFMEAYGDLISQTSTEDAPWHVVPANRKWYRNLVVTQIMIDALESLDMSYPQITWDPSDFDIKE